MKKIILLLFFLPLLVCAQESVSELELKLHSSTGNEKVDVMNKLSSNFLYDDINKSLNFAQQALNFALLQHYKFGEGNALENLGNCYEMKLEYRNAISYFKQARDAYLLAKNPSAIANILNYLGIVYESINDYTQAMGYYKQSYDTYAEIQDIQGMALLLTNIGSVYETLGKYDKALEYYLRSMSEYEQINDKEGIASSLNNIGNVYQVLSDLDKALEFLQQARDMYKSIGDSVGVAMAVHNIGIIYHDMGEYEKALEYYFTSMQTDIDRDDKMGIAASYNNIAIVYDEMNELDKSLDYYKRSLALSEMIIDNFSIANTMNNMGYLYLKMNQDENAHTHFMKALHIAEDIGSQELIKESYDGLSQYYQKQKDFQKSLEFYERSEDIKDSLFSINTQRQIAKLQLQYDLESKEREIRLLQKDNEIKKLQLNRQKNLRYFFLAIFIFLVFLILLIYYAYITKIRMTKNLLKEIEERVKIEEQLKLSVKEKNVMLKEIHHRVKNNMQIISSLLHLQSRHITDERSLQAFQVSQDRIRSMALIHEKLYRSSDFSSIDFSEYVQDLINNLHQPEFDNVKISIDVQDVVMDINKAIPCGLIINELVTNAFKHAFPDGREGKIEITMNIHDQKSILLIVSDNGIGIPEEVDFRATKSLGLQLVTGLVRQLQGNIDVERSTGTKFTIIF
ncbi:MAG: tetratricopeptide repeat protein [Candidatus Cloacimonetes bacterium]|nr:tetratricopeptide repeat protein [Candidatus Cloacimonadota bacterium]